MTTTPVENEIEMGDERAFASAVASDAQTAEAVPPWGRLQYERIVIAPPDEYVKLVDTGLYESDWYFPERERKELAARFAAFGVDRAVQRQLLNASELDEDAGCRRVYITNDLIRSIPIETRAKIYNYLQQDDRNVAQTNAFRFCSDSVDDWFDGTQVRPSVIDRVKGMVFRNGSYLVFADFRLIEAELQNEFEKSQLLKSLCRDSTLVMYLQFDSQTDIDQLVRYWGRHGRGKDVRPLIESLALQSGPTKIDVSHLLPAFARRRIYSYPNLTTDDVIRRRDCHWTAHNFLSSIPDDRLVTNLYDELSRRMDGEFYQIFGDYKMGDLVEFIDQEGTVFHSATYIADDVLFTKNGYSALGSWHFCRLSEMKDYYTRRTPVRVSFFRRKTS